MAVVQFSSGTNQQLLIQYLYESNESEFRDDDSEVWVKDSVLDDRPDIVDYIFSLSGAIIGRHGY